VQDRTRVTVFAASEQKKRNHPDSIPLNSLVLESDGLSSFCWCLKMGKHQGNVGGRNAADSFRLIEIQGTNFRQFFPSLIPQRPYFSVVE
jgi:hypothetical protein